MQKIVDNSLLSIKELRIYDDSSPNLLLITDYYKNGDLENFKDYSKIVFLITLLEYWYFFITNCKWY